jgi:hypothetical protein
MQKLFYTVLELFGCIKIMLSPFLMGLIIGALCYIGLGNDLGRVLGVLIALSGLVIGAIWATKVYKKQGTIQFLSRIMATPELDKDDVENNS